MKLLSVRAAAALVAARKEAGLTQQDLAKRSGIEQTNISRIEVGKHLNVTLETLDRLAKAMKKYVEVVYKEL
jgi:transcriptional regulator with XRE-family HTH domain